MASSRFLIPVQAALTGLTDRHTHICLRDHGGRRGMEKPRGSRKVSLVIDIHDTLHTCIKLSENK